MVTDADGYEKEELLPFADLSMHDKVRHWACCSG